MTNIPVNKNLKTHSGIENKTVKPMTLSEKILYHHAIGISKSKPYIEPGEMICVKVQWTLASEITWKSMDKTYQEMGRPRIWRNDRFWLAVDHTVDPRVNHLPKQKMMIQSSEDFAKEAKLIDYYKPNTTILHTEFYRQRAQPGQIVVGADSHSCSTGGLGAFAIGLGAADVVMPLVTGETWIKVPETIKVEFVGTPPFGIGGKDIMLYTLGLLKCNTVAIGKCVEWAGNIKSLSCDARFAISNMTAEFGGITGIFQADELTANYINLRKDHNRDALYFRADPDAKYANEFKIYLDECEPQVALYPSPDNVVPVTKVFNKPLDGCFIGACTTSEEDLILAAIVLKEQLKQGFQPINKGQRRVTPGSQKIVERLKSFGLIEIYEKSGFAVGAPGCSFCLGIAADVAKKDEVWLSSQNRNYKNRMGKGSIANLASAATVAASSFNMKITDPRPFLQAIDMEYYNDLKKKILGHKTPIISISEPCPVISDDSVVNDKNNNETKPVGFEDNITGYVQLFGDNVDTDAILPGEYLCENDMEKLGKVAFLHTNPNFRQKVSEGYTIIVAGKGFGCGSSREQAVTALKGSGVKAVIAKSFGYIFSRNYQNFSLVGITLNDAEFYNLMKDNHDKKNKIDILMKKRTIIVNEEHTFRFQMSLFEERLLAGGGIMPLYKKYKNKLFRVAISRDENENSKELENNSCLESSCTSKSSNGMNEEW